MFTRRADDLGWVKASKLVIGDGQWVAVEDLLETGEWEVVYNLRIADYHTYFVTDWDWGLSVWSHNTVGENGQPCERISQARQPRLDGRDMQRINDGGIRGLLDAGSRAAGAGDLPKNIENAIFSVRQRVDGAIRTVVQRTIGTVLNALGLGNRQDVSGRIGGPVELKLTGANQGIHSLSLRRRSSAFEMMFDGTVLRPGTNITLRGNVQTAWDAVMRDSEAAANAQAGIPDKLAALAQINRTLTRDKLQERNTAQAQLAALYTPMETLKNDETRLRDAIAADATCLNGVGCFAAGTLLLSPNGPKAVEEFKIGDAITSRNEYEPGGALEVKTVEEVFRRTARIVHLHVGGQAIRTTSEHPFFAYNKGWVQPSLLEVGDQLLGHDGQWVAVEDVLDTGDWESVYNLRIADYHTYFVTDWDWGFSVWSHNTNACTEGIFRAMRPDGSMPRLGQNASSLGIRPGTDIEVTSGNVDLPAFAPHGKNGLSCRPTIQSIPPQFRPSEWNGTSPNMKVWEISPSDLGSDLTWREDSVPGASDRHISIGPARTMTLGAFVSAIEATRSHWHLVTP